MKTYKTEDDIDFYAELYSSLDNEITTDKEKTCLITDEPLIDRYVTLDCNHSFNYVPLYKDLVNHKTKFNGMESSGLLKNGEIRCPYCRQKQAFILPFYKDLGLKNVSGITTKPEAVYSSSFDYSIKMCQYVTNPNQITSDTNTVIDMSANIQTCTKYGNKFEFDLELMEDNEEPLTKYYCCTHKRIVIAQRKKDLREKMRLAKENEKKLKKEMNTKKVSQSKKMENNNSNLVYSVSVPGGVVDLTTYIGSTGPYGVSTNVTNTYGYTGPSVNTVVYNYSTSGMTGPVNTNTCKQCLVSGPRKGLQCTMKVFEGEYCKRHYDKKTS
jgi:hypothetical protein